MMKCKNAFDAIYQVFGLSPLGYYDIVNHKDYIYYDSILKFFPDMTRDQAKEKLNKDQQLFSDLLQESNLKIKETKNHLKPYEFLLI